MSVELAVCQKVPRDSEQRLAFETALLGLLYCHVVRSRSTLDPADINEHEAEGRGASLSAMVVPAGKAVQLYPSLESFVQDYRTVQEFVGVEKNELRKLYQFTNFMKVALLLFPNPKFKKAHLLDLTTRASEGRRVKYITGSGQTIDTSRRVRVYEREAGM
jgi:hypothetical protein